MRLKRTKKQKQRDQLSVDHDQNLDQKHQVIIKPDQPINLFEQPPISIKAIDGKTFTKVPEFENQLEFDQKIIYGLKKLITYNSDFPILEWPNQVFEKSLIQAIAKAIANRDENLNFNEQDLATLKTLQVDLIFLNDWISRYQNEMKLIFAKNAPENANLTPKRQNKYLSQALISPSGLIDKIQIAHNLKQANQSPTKD